MNIELNNYGFCIDTHFFYIALSYWAIGAMSVLGATIYAYKKWSNRK